jgi:glycosyltransferase involved in cell wall biosynthesis
MDECMKVLLITGQCFVVKNNTVHCTLNVYDIIERFSHLGELSICCIKHDEAESYNTIEKDITHIVSPDRLSYIKREFFFPLGGNTKTLEKEIAKVDLVIGYVPFFVAERAMNIAHRLGKKYMAYLVSNVLAALWYHCWKGKILAIPSYWHTKRTLKRSDFALYVTQNFLQRMYPCKGLSCGCSDVKIPALVNRIIEDRISFIKESDISKELHIATVASIQVRYKGQQYMIEALAALKKEGVTNIHYHLYGGGRKDRLQRLADKLGVAEQVHFEGIIPHSELFEALDHMHAYILPSLQEGLPRSLVEAMSRGLLCVAADTASMPELLEKEYIVRQKSSRDIANVLRSISKENLIAQAKRNFNEAKKFQDDVLTDRREKFFDEIKEIMDTNN